MSVKSEGGGGALLSVKSEGGGCSSEIPSKFTRILGTRGLILSRIIIENNEQEKSRNHPDYELMSMINNN